MALTYQMAIILNTLGPDKNVWVNKKAKWIEICENQMAVSRFVTGIRFER
jgi:hypothetical protein